MVSAGIAGLALKVLLIQGQDDGCSRSLELVLKPVLRRVGRSFAMDLLNGNKPSLRPFGVSRKNR